MESLYINAWAILCHSWLYWKIAAAILAAYSLLHYTFKLYRQHPYLFQFTDKNKAFLHLVALVLPVARKINMPKYKKFLTKNLRRAGKPTDWTAEHFIAQHLIQLSLVLSGVLSIVALMNVSSMLPFLMIIVIACILPIYKLNHRANQRYASCNKDLPFFIDYLCLTIEAGLEFQKAIATVIGEAPPSPLREEFSLALQNMKLGKSRQEALEEMQDRIDAPSLKLFTQTLIQAMKMGSNLVQTLAVLSDTIRTRRFQQAEEKAGKISVQMMIPMMIFVMPATMIILLGPMIIEWLQKTV